MQDYLITVPFNDFELIERTIEDHYWEIAAMIVEPGMGNVAAVEALPGYLEHLRKLCDEYGIVLIFDEVKTGFRLSNSGAREVYGVTPDLSTYAKSLGNGYPVAAFGGKQAIMEIIGPNSVAHGGTFSANKLSLAAANAVLDVLTDSPVLAKMAQRGHRLRSGLSEILSDASIPHQMSGHPNMPGILFTEKPITEYRHMVYHNEELYGQVLHNLYTLGVWAEDDARELWFLCEAHTDEIIDQTLNKFEEAVKATVS
jgi:glutamate-1-semialdehyde 2,1-aminomutase